MNNLKIGMIGLDSSHCIEFTNLLNNPQHSFHVGGAVINSVYPFYSEYLPLSKNRFPQFRDKMKSQFSINMVDSIDELARSSDGILITAVDGSKHLSLFKELLPYKLPVFIDKPLSYSHEEAKELLFLAQKYDIPLMSSSSLRFADSFHKFVTANREDVTGMYVHGPLPMEEGIPGYLWYGIHMIEMVVAAMGVNIEKIHLHKNSQYETVILEWADGRHAILHGEYQWHPRFAVTLHTNHGYQNIEIAKDKKPYYASLLEQIVPFIKTRKSPVPPEETLEILRICCEINQTRALSSTAVKR
ncbi:Gfo/Idh/MocA family protein [Neobacillus sp. Marseille-QA0830]